MPVNFTQQRPTQCKVALLNLGRLECALSTRPLHRSLIDPPIPCFSPMLQPITCFSSGIPITVMYGLGNHSIVVWLRVNTASLSSFSAICASTAHYYAPICSATTLIQPVPAQIMQPTLLEGYQASESCAGVKS